MVIIERHLGDIGVQEIARYTLEELASRLNVQSKNYNTLQLNLSIEYYQSSRTKYIEELISELCHGVANIQYANNLLPDDIIVNNKISLIEINKKLT